MKEFTDSPALYLEPSALQDAVDRLAVRGYEEVIEALEASPHELVSDVYALQQVVYRHHIAGDREYGYLVADRLISALAEVFPLTEADIVLSRWLGERFPTIAARERLHLAVMKRHGVQHLVTGVPYRYRHVSGIHLTNIRELL